MDLSYSIANLDTFFGSHTSNNLYIQQWAITKKTTQSEHYRMLVLLELIIFFHHQSHKQNVFLKYHFAIAIQILKLLFFHQQSHKENIVSVKCFKNTLRLIMQLPNLNIDAKNMIKINPFSSFIMNPWKLRRVFGKKSISMLQLHVFIYQRTTTLQLKSWSGKGYRQFKA